MTQERGKGEEGEEGMAKGEEEEKEQKKKKTQPKEMSNVIPSCSFLKFLFIILNTIKRASVSQGYLRVPMSQR